VTERRTAVAEPEASEGTAALAVSQALAASGAMRAPEVMQEMQEAAASIRWTTAEMVSDSRPRHAMTGTAEAMMAALATV
jgi:hypothetical protein